ncbi:Rossmann-like domain-containing protein [Oceanidesulfovibrio marinus]|uniref:Putative heavy-metal chelation domain-containing protein n=1 Tax=Oceanidesulfovibrio marinus TaxID=370038 RepID=A0A6P1ZDS3_9BACT|nr:DUF364 domain-containing protein [Oceanidesulfovibrio marinus]TVM32595.1 hypothetical protein DQK91_15095 [Oceanidesulfovibrio marinus]
MQSIDQHTILQAIVNDIHSLTPSATLPADDSRVASGSHLVAVHVDSHLGLASRLRGVAEPTPLLSATNAPTEERTLPPLTELAASLPGYAAQDTPTLAPSLALAAVNALLPVPDAAADLKGQDLLLEYGAGKDAVVIGHFPFVNKIAKEFRSFHVLEKEPRPGDLHADEAATVLPSAGVVAVTGTTLLNGTLAGILALCPDAFVLLMGPSAPFAPSLFQAGVNAIAGNAIADPDAVLAGVAAGLPYRRLDGVSSLTWLATDVD